MLFFDFLLLLTYLSLFVTACQDFLQTKFYKLILTVVILTIRGIHLFVLGFEKFFSVCMNTETPCSGEFE